MSAAGDRVEVGADARERRRPGGGERGEGHERERGERRGPRGPPQPRERLGQERGGREVDEDGGGREVAPVEGVLLHPAQGARRRARRRAPRARARRRGAARPRRWARSAGSARSAEADRRRGREDERPGAGVVPGVREERRPRARERRDGERRDVEPERARR